MDHYPEELQDQSASPCYDYYTTGGRCRPAPEKKTRNYGWLAAVMGMLLLCMVAWMSLDSEEKPEPAAVPASLAESELTAARLLPDATAEETQPSVKDPGSDAHMAVKSLRAGELTLPQIYEKLIPSVVSISSAAKTGTSTGTGIVMSRDGYLITNYHVVSGGGVITVLLSTGEELTAALVGGDETSDLAVLKVEAEDLTPAEFGSSDEVRVGDSVVAIGDPLGVELRGTMTDGIICGIQRDVQVGDRVMNLMQTNAALNAGNSGGPLVNMAGQVIGINTVKLQSYYNSVEGIGFAIPVSAAQPIVDELLEKGYVSGRPAFGFTVETLPAQMRLFYSLPGALYVRSVTEDAAAQGISEGDVIIAIDGEYVSSLDEFNTVKNQHSAGDSVSLTVFRKGEELELTLTLVDRATLG